MSPDGPPLPPDPALAQRRAAAPGASVWVAASAGTGKTKVLTDRVLNLLLAGTAPERILCLTFTKAAAAEMANRLNRRLGQWATMPDADLADEIRELAGAAPDEARLAAARRLFARVLDTPGGLKIQTIHSFCQAVLARFPLEAGIAPHSQVADERTAAELLESARNGLLHRARREADSALAAALATATRHVAQGEFGRLMGELIAERGRLRRLLAAHGGLDGAVARMRARLGLPADATEAALLEAACADAACAADALRRACDALDGGTDSERERAAAIRRWLDDPAGRLAGLETYRLIFLSKEGEIRKRLVSRKTADACPDAEAALAAEAERLAALRAQCGAVAVADATAALLRLAAGLLDDYEALKRERGLLDYDDLILATRDLLRDRSAAAWVLYKLDGGLDHILIDEAQDTNPDQWEVVAALAEDFFAGESGRDAARTVFAVGDGKQSIFSFQRADPAKFEAMRAHFRERAGAAEGGWDDVSLDVSFRSAPAVLEAVDAVFAGPAGAGVVPPGVTLRHHPHRQGHAGLVELWPPVAPAETEAGGVWEAPRAYAASPSPQRRLAEAIADTIRNWLDRREPLPSRGRPIRPGDVMILVRRRTAFVEETVRALKARGVPVAGVDRMRLTEQLAVEDLVALGQFLLLPEDDMTLAIVLRSPLVGLDEDQLYLLAADRGRRTLWEQLAELAAAEADSAFGRARAMLADLLRRADYAPPYELFAELLGPGGGRRRLVARLGPEANDPLDEFLAQALAYGRTNVPSLQGFLHWLGADEGDVKRDLEQGERDEVRIMTVHGAKGLQAPIVFVPDTLRIPDRLSNLLWSPEGDLALWTPRKEFREPVGETLRREAERRRDEEYRRLLYVALTRAEDRLYVCGWSDDGKEPREGCWYRLTAEALAGLRDVAPFEFGAAYGYWPGEGLRLAAAQTAPPRPDGRTGVAADAAEALPAWAFAAAPEPSAGRALAPSRPEEDEPAVASPLGADQGRRFRRGILIHRLLQHLPEVAEAERPAACARYLARAGELDAAEQAAIAAECLAVLAHPEFAPIFGPGSRAEQPVSGVIGGMVVCGQIDRLRVTATEVLVVDYKSNRPPPPGPEAVAPAYLRQMAAYRALLARIYPGRAVRCALLWTETPKLMPLGADLLDRHAPAGALDAPHTPS